MDWLWFLTPFAFLALPIGLAIWFWWNDTAIF